MANRIVQAVYDLKDNITGKLRSIGEALGAHRTESGKTADAVERDNKRASESYKQTADSLGFLRDNLGKIAAAAAAAMAALKAIDFGKHAFQGAADVEQSLARVKALASTAADDFGKLAEQIDRSAIAADVSTAQAAATAAALAEQGQSAVEIFQTLTPTLLLAKTANLEVAETAGVVDDALDLFGKNASDAALMVDQLVAASKGSKEGIGGMATAIRALAPDARALGMDFEHLTGLLGVFGQNGIDAGKAAKGLRSIFQDLQDPTSKFSLSLSKLGDSSGNFSTAIETLRNSGKRGEDALLGLDGATRSLVLFLLQQAPGAVDAFTASLAEAGGTAAATAEVIDSTFKGAYDALGNALDRLGEGLLKTSLEPLRVEMKKLAGQLTEFAASPAFEHLKAALTGIFENGTLAFDNFIQSIDWSGLVDGAQNAFESVGSNIADFSGKLSAAAEGMNKIAAGIGLVVRSISVVFDLAKVGISELVSAKSAQLAALSAAVDKVTGTTSQLTIALESLRDAASSASEDGLSALRDNSDRVVDNLTALFTSAKEATPALQAVGDKLGGVAANAQAVDGATGKAVAGLDAVKGSATNAATTLGILPKLLTDDATAAAAAAAAHKAHAEQIIAARQAVDDARAALAALSQSGERNSVAFQQAAQALQAAQAELDRLTGKADASAAAQRGLEQAFKSLRITSQAELRQAAADAEMSFATIQRAFEAGKVSIEDMRRAFEAYAQQQRASVADSDQWVKDQLEGQLAVKASVLGLGDAFAKSSASGQSAGETIAAAFDKARGSIDGTAKAADGLAKSTSEAAIAADRIGQSAKANADAIGTVVALSIDQQAAFRRITEELMRAGDLQSVSLEEAKRLLAEIGNLSSGHAQLLTQRINELEDAARRAEDVARRMADEAASLQDQIDQMQGNEIDIEDRRHARKLADLRAEAEAQGMLNTAEYRRLVELENKLHDLKLQNLRDDRNVASGAGRVGGGRSDRDNGADAPAGSSVPMPEGGAPGRQPYTIAASPVINAVFLSGDQKAVNQIAELLARPMYKVIKDIEKRSR